MHYTNPRFQQMRPSYERSQGSFGTQSGSLQEVGQEGLIHPGLLNPGGVPYEAHETANLPQVYPAGLGSPVVHPAFQQGWPTQTLTPIPETSPMGLPIGAPGRQSSNAPVHAPGIPFLHNLSPFGLQGGLGQAPWAQQSVPPGISQTPQGQTSLPSQQGWGSLSMTGRPDVTRASVRQPAFDLIDEGENLVFEFEMPGVSKTDVQLVCNEKGLSVRASTKEGQHEEDEYLHAERGRVKYERYIPLDLAIVPDKVKAHFQNGILTVTCQKQQPSSGLQKVEIT